MIFQGGFEINLDHRKLKTPQAKLFTVPSEALAIAVATEWDSQQDTIKFYTMHLVTSSRTYTPTAGFLGYLAKIESLFQIQMRPSGVDSSHTRLLERADPSPAGLARCSPPAQNKDVIRIQLHRAEPGSGEHETRAASLLPGLL